MEYDDAENMWLVTIGFSRPWDELKGPFDEFAGAKKRRDYKVVRIVNSTDGTYEVRSVRRLEARI